MFLYNSLVKDCFALRAQLHFSVKWEETLSRATDLAGGPSTVAVLQ